MNCALPSMTSIFPPKNNTEKNIIPSIMEILWKKILKWRKNCHVTFFLPTDANISENELKYIQMTKKRILSNKFIKVVSNNYY